jgi:phosphate:Na+ symporter
VWLEALQIIGEMLAGLALFFFGIQRLSSQLRQITGRKFRMILQRATRSPLLSALAGALLGATMQTGSAITFILVSMVGAGMITVDRSLPVRLGAAVGTSTMVFVATLNIQLIILFLLGVSGILITQMRSTKPVLGVLFGGGLMFYGLQMVGGSASSLTDLQWFSSAIASVEGFAIAAFLLGAMLSMVIQSPQSVAILAIALTSADVLSTWTTIAIIYGSNFGGGISTFLLSAGFRGTSRQIMVFQTLFNVLTGIVLLALFYIERFTGIPLVHAFVTSLGSAVAQQMAVVYLIFNVFGAVMMFILRTPILGWIEKRWPPAPEEDIARLQYLQDHTMDTPDLALELAEKEQKRFISLVQGNLDALRMPEEQGRATGETTARAIGKLHEALDDALTELSSRVGTEGSEHMISLTNRNQLLGSLQQSMAEYGTAIRHARKSPSLAQLCSVFLESLDALFGASVEAVESNDHGELERILNATHSRSKQMRSIRKRMLSGDQVLSDEDRLDLINLTNGLERTVWMLHEYIGELMEQYPQGRPSVASAQ